jgi:hypothetical protein
MRRRARALVLLPVVLGLALMAGCGRSGPARHEVSGTVLFDGKPLDEGVIRFEPLDGQASLDGATISNGAYRIPKDKGLFPGRYKVLIIGGDGTSGSGNALPKERAPGVTPGKERIPPRYNTASDVIREVKDEEPNRFDFDIPRAGN